MVNSSGTIVARYNYDPYGRTTLVSGTNLSTFQYAGYYTHATSGLNLTMFRAYDPNVGRWLNRDFIGENRGINLYGYVGDDPENSTDPIGLFAPAPPPVDIPPIPPPVLVPVAIVVGGVIDIVLISKDVAGLIELQQLQQQAAAQEAQNNALEQQIKKSSPKKLNNFPKRLPDANRMPPFPLIECHLHGPGSVFAYIIAPMVRKKDLSPRFVIPALFRSQENPVLLAFSLTVFGCHENADARTC